MHLLEKRYPKSKQKEKIASKIWSLNFVNFLALIKLIFDNVNFVEDYCNPAWSYKESHVWESLVSTEKSKKDILPDKGEGIVVVEVVTVVAIVDVDLWSIVKGRGSCVEIGCRFCCCCRSNWDSCCCGRGWSCNCCSNGGSVVVLEVVLEREEERRML